jgi:hypothetical protein
MCAALLSGCCPGGAAVLSGLTLPAEQQAEACRLESGPALGSNPAEFIGDDLARIQDRSTAAAVAELVGSSAGEDAHRYGVKYVYTAEYGCASGNADVGVAAVMFREPTDAVRASRLEASPMNVIFKGQLAAIVWSRGEGCEDCYRTLHDRAEKIIGRDQ